MEQNTEDWITLFQRALARWDLLLTSEAEENFRVYARELASWNERLNLTALREPLHVALGHFADSLSPLSLSEVFGRRNVRAIDIGSGAGFPGLPLKIMNPDWEIGLIESVQKKCDFLKAICRALELNHVAILNRRSEELGQDKAHRERYDLAFARALSGLPTLIEYGLPLLRVGGHLVAHRGRTAADEVTRSANALEELGGEVTSVRHYEIPGLGGSRSLVLIRKIRPTTKHYPRRVGVPAKRPL